jgi:hypothetical protein
MPGKSEKTKKKKKKKKKKKTRKEKEQRGQQRIRTTVNFVSHRSHFEAKLLKK